MIVFFLLKCLLSIFNYIEVIVQSFFKNKNDCTIQYYYITNDNPKKKILLEPKENLYLDCKNIIEIVLPPCKKVWCEHNKLIKLIIPDGCEYVYCQYNKLTELILPQSCKRVYCYCNYLTELILPEGCEIISCDSNKLTELTILEGCEEVSCWNNNLTKLIVPKSCICVNCYSNKLHPIVENLLQSDDFVKMQLANSLQK